MNATPAMTKKIRDLARDAYDQYGFLRKEYKDGHGNGSFRSVTLADGVAIKFARSGKYTVHNRVEWDAWHKFPKSIQCISAKPFCISTCSRVMAVELIPQTLNDAYSNGDRGYYASDLSAFNESLRELLEDNGFSEGEVSALMVDNHANNVGVRDNGDLCWIDYAGYAD